MSKGKYFAVVNWPKGKLTAITSSDSVGGQIDQIAIWDTEDEARKVMDEQPLGKQFGYEIFNYFEPL